MLINVVYITSSVTKSQPNFLHFVFDSISASEQPVDRLLGRLVAVVRPELVAANALDAADPNALVGLVISLHLMLLSVHSFM